MYIISYFFFFNGCPMILIGKGYFKFNNYKNINYEINEI